MRISNNQLKVFEEDFAGIEEQFNAGQKREALRQLTMLTECIFKEEISFYVTSRPPSLHAHAPRQDVADVGAVHKCDDETLGIDKRERKSLNDFYELCRADLMAGNLVPPEFQEQIVW